MYWKTGLIFLVVVGIFAIDFVSCEDDKSKDSSEDNSDSSEETKDGATIREKRSDEEIMFGNQQNKANGAVNDFLMSIDPKEDGDKKAEKKNESDKEDLQVVTCAPPQIVVAKSPEDAENAKQGENDPKDDKDPKKSDSEEDDFVLRPDPHAEMAAPPAYLGIHNAPANAAGEALQYIFSNHPMPNINPDNNYVDIRPVYDKADLYRKKRQSSMSNRPVSLMKRSLRSPIGQMIRTRRLPRRSMRLKRHSTTFETPKHIDQIMAMIREAEAKAGGNLYNNLLQRENQERNTVFRHRNLPYPYPYDNMPAGNGMDLENSQNENDVDDSSIDQSKDLAGALMYPPPPPSSRYFSISDYSAPKEQDGAGGEVLPRWMEPSTDRVRPPWIFTVDRRATPLFYPIDYRFVPGYKKRSNLNDEDDDDDEDNNMPTSPLSFGKWGRVVDAPGAYASAEDVARLYALANLLAENDNAGVRVRRSA